MSYPFPKKLADYGGPLVRLLLFSVLGGGAALVVAEWLRRRHEWLSGQNYVQHLEQWRQMEPIIPKLETLPDVQPLKVKHTRLKKQGEPLRLAGRKWK